MQDKFCDESIKRADEICSMITDDNYREISKDLSDGLGGLLANAAISIAEQKRLLQKAKTPSALVSAIKAITVTSANLANAGAGLLSWLGNKLPRRDSLDMDVVLHASDSKNTYEILRDSSNSFAVAKNFDSQTGLFDSVKFGFTSADEALKSLGEFIKE